MSYSPDIINKMLTSDNLELIGMGSRRACYKLPDDHLLCLKCYRSDEEISKGKNPWDKNSKPLSPQVIKEIHSYRHDRNKNACCQEFDYWKVLKKKAPAELISVFPETMEIIHTPSRGWCLIEEHMLNDDGTPITKFLPTLKAACANDRKTLIELFETLEKELVKYAIRFFDPQTLMVQLKNGRFRLRIPDFEPTTRTLLPFDTLFLTFTKLKIKRRFARYRKTWEQLV